MERARVEWSRQPTGRHQLGLVLFEDDPVSAPTLQRLLDPMGIDVQAARIGFPAEGGGETFAARLRAAAASILPAAAPAVMGFACTTGALGLGADRIREAIARPGAVIEPVTPVDGVIAALRMLAVRRVAILSPYAEVNSEQVAQHIEACGFPVSQLSYFDAANEDIPSIAADSIMVAARNACAHGDADAIFLSCTGLRATPLIPALEADLGIAVLTSLQVMAWRAVKLLGLAANGPGRLFCPNAR